MILALPSAHDLATGLIVAQIAAPAATLLALGLPALLGRPPSERATTRAVSAGFGLTFLAALVSLAVGAARGFPVEVVHLGTLFAVGHHAATVELVAPAARAMDDTIPGALKRLAAPGNPTRFHPDCSGNARRLPIGSPLYDHVSAPETLRK